MAAFALAAEWQCEQTTCAGLNLSVRTEIRNGHTSSGWIMAIGCAAAAAMTVAIAQTAPLVSLHIPSNYQRRDGRRIARLIQEWNPEIIIEDVWRLGIADVSSLMKRGTGRWRRHIYLHIAKRTRTQTIERSNE
jgi:hypothetical protein